MHKNSITGMERKIIITIGREFGTGGRKIATELSKMLGINLYDKHLLDDLKERYHLTTEQMDKIRAQKKNWLSELKVFVPEVTPELIYQEEERILKELAEKESCIILGRTGYHIFRDNPNAFRVFLIADMPYRRDKVARRLNVNEGSADLLIKQVDEARENYSQTFSGTSRNDVHNYDLILNVTGLEADHVAKMIVECLKQRF